MQVILDAYKCVFDGRREHKGVGGVVDLLCGRCMLGAGERCLLIISDDINHVSVICKHCVDK